MLITFASKNSHKLIEIKKIFQNSGYEILPMPTFIQEPQETGTTFQENALLKAYYTSQYVKSPVIADDSGLEVDALNGEPGIFSARYAGKGASSEDNIQKLLTKLKGIPIKKRTARFHCVVAYVRSHSDPEPIITHATWEGYILLTTQGIHGFGYDPIFFVPEYNCSAAELTPEIKNQISHRAQAIQKLINIINRVSDQY